MDDEVLIEREFYFQMVGPKEELDKLAEVKWNSLSIKSYDDEISEPFECIRISDNMLYVKYIGYVPGFVPDAVAPAGASIN